ncbi:hypothetical protein OG875_14330 [Streptomyces sp. NBC_01498]|uniref:hypothetical protein n=1 Tax=Streptomyces sp. NBC_01498 TaxID=2975870 RepID=UPI002E7B3380|nr:hypothetical protein [Streptomyces sp. NBC_01498]WTL25674.1 hypothetical protein OG875_14330 [Streptomyces sp. NBC_01498]
MVAGIARQEIGGRPGCLDDITDAIREQADADLGLSPVSPENLPSRLGGDPDETSLTPVPVPVQVPVPVSEVARPCPPDTAYGRGLIALSLS